MLGNINSRAHIVQIVRQCWEENDWLQFVVAIVPGAVARINGRLTSHAERRQF